MQRERQAIGSSRADQWRATDLHGANGVRGFAHTRQGDDFPLAGQTSLIDDLDGASGKRRTQGLDVGRFHKLFVKPIGGRLNRLYLMIWMILLKSSVQSRRFSRIGTTDAASAICGTWSEASRSDKSTQSLRLATPSSPSSTTRTENQ